MNFISILGLAIALAMDAFAVAIAVGISLRNVNYRQVLRLSWHFGFFQGGMTVLGWWFGFTIYSFIETFAHWLSFGLLFLIGGNMLKEALKHNDTHWVKKDTTKGLQLIMLSVATSIDAMAAGLSLSFLNISVVTPSIIIGLVALIFTITGLYIGQRVSASNTLTTYSNVLGCIVLWGIGITILYNNI